MENKEIEEKFKLMSKKELQLLIDSAKKELEGRTVEGFIFHFDATSDTRKRGGPYAAKLTIGDDGKIERHFFDLDKTYAKHDVTVSGEYEAKNGEIIEERQGGSWKNDYRYWYLIDDGKQTLVADIDDSIAKNKVKRYLKGKITKEELLQPSKR